MIKKIPLVFPLKILSEPFLLLFCRYIKLLANYPWIVILVVVPLAISLTVAAFLTQDLPDFSNPIEVRKLISTFHLTLMPLVAN